MARDKNCSWHFAVQTGIDEGPNDAIGQHFKKSQSPYSALIRESIQNSLDAVLDESQPVRVSIGIKSMTMRDFPGFFELKRHIKGCIDLYPDNSNAENIYKPMLELFDGDFYSQSLDYIKVTDANTKGMAYKEGDTNCPFYAFALSRGVSAKENQSAGGSFGFGKAAYFNMSPIRTILVSTLTPRNEYVFEGIASLCTHLYNREKKTSVGYYDNNNGLPITDVDKIPAPFRQQECGTSVYIMGVNINNRQDVVDDMVYAVLRNFWMAIWNNKLSVNVDGKEINQTTLSDFMETVFPDEIETGKQSRNYNPRPYFDAVRFVGTSSRYKDIPESVIDDIGEVRLYVNLNRDAIDKIIFMRKPMMYVYAKQIGTSYGVNGVFICTGKKGNDILRKIENPAHDEWKADNWKDETNHTCKEGKKALEAINQYITKSLEALFASDEEKRVNILGLEDYLFVPENLISGQETSVPKNMQESLVGKPTGEYKDDGSSVTTQIEVVSPKVKVEKEVQMGHVVVVSGGSVSTNPMGDRIVGTGRAHKGKGHKNVNPAAGRQKYSLSDIDDKGEGSYLEYIPVYFRVVAQREKGDIYHSIIFHSLTATNNGEIELAVGGEQADEVLSIVETNIGKIRDNFVTGLNVVKGRNVVKVRFADNMKHAVILRAYERK